MSKDKSILKNTFTYGSASAITTLIMFFLYLIAARYLGAEDFGRFSFAVAFVTLFAPLLDPGLYYLLIREVARRKHLSEKYLSHTLTWKVFCAPFVFLIICGTVSFMHKSPMTLQAVYLMAVSQILLSWKDAFRPILLAHEFFGLDAISVFIERLSLLIFSSLVLLYENGLLGFCWVFIIVRIIDLSIIAVVVQLKVCRFSFGRELAFVKHLLLSAVPIGAFYMTLKIYNHVDTVMLSLLRSDIEVGWYSASYKLYEGPLLIPSVIATVFMPRLSRLFLENNGVFITLLERGIKYVVLTSLIVGVNGILFSDILVRLSFGEMYLNSIYALQVLFAGFIFVFTVNFLQTVMISVDHQKLIFYVSSAGLAVNVLFNAILIPLYGYMGAAFATVVVEGLVCAILCWIVHRVIFSIDWWGVWVKPLLIGFGWGAVIFLVVDIPSVYQALLWNTGFLGLLYFLKVLNKGDLETTEVAPRI